jgi:hypothetical protein
MATYTAAHFAKALGSRPEDWALRPTDTVIVDENDRITVDSRFLGHVTSTERAWLEGEKGPSSSFDVSNALIHINRHRRRLGMRSLDPYGAGWTDEDILVESRRISRLENSSMDWSPGWAPAFALGGGLLGGMLFTGLGRAAFGTDTDALAALIVSRIVGQVVGASGLAAATAPEGMRARAALGAAAGGWVPYLGVPLAAVGTYVATRSRKQNPLSPPAKRWLWIGGVGAATLLVGGVAYAKLRTPTPAGPPTPTRAIATAIGILGSDAEVIEVTDVAYTMAYPDCPVVLDPDDPTHELCIEYWLHLRDLAIEQMPPPESRPAEEQPGLSMTGPAADMRGWLESLTQRQRSELRRIIGSKYYDPIKRGAYDGDDAGVVSAVLRFKNAAQKHASEDKFGALKRYLELQELLGAKLDELMQLAQQYEGQA